MYRKTSEKQIYLCSNKTGVKTDMYKNNKIQYIIKTCSSEDTQELQNLLNEMSMNGWELYSMSEVETDDGFKYNCIFMSENGSAEDNSSGDIIKITSFKSQMEKMLSCCRQESLMLCLRNYVHRYH